MMAFLADSLVKKIFGERAGEYAVDPDFQNYFRELSTLSGDRLAHEPDRLTEERANLQEETENLAYSNYKTFIQAANCSKEIYDDFTLIEGNVDRLLQSLPGLNEKCESFLSEARKINSRRAGNSLALQKHSQVLEILEIPQVMDTCVRAGYYEEALELAQYATKLDRRLGHIPIVKSIASEVSRQRELLLENLLEQLHTSLTLSQCLKVVGYCRRLNVFTEAELRTKFLLARNSWFENMLAAVPRDDAYQHITKVMELSRVHLFDIITQYRAAFPDDDPLFLPVGVVRMGGGLMGNDDSSTWNIPAIFHSWLFDQVEKFLNILAADLAVLSRSPSTVARLDSVMAQCMYFGLSFGRVGADFRSLTAPIFENATWNFFASNMDKAFGRLSQDLQRSRLLAIFAESANRAKFSSLLSSNPDTSSSVDPNASAHSQPPLSLLEFPPLAHFCNAVLTTFNDLRTCFPVTLASRVAAKLHANVEDSIRNLMDLKKELEIDGKISAFIDRTINLILNDLAPYFNACLESLFPSKQLAGIIGVNMADFAQMGYVARLNLNELNVLVKGKEEVVVISPSSGTESDVPPVSGSSDLQQSEVMTT